MLDHFYMGYIPLFRVQSSAMVSVNYALMMDSAISNVKRENILEKFMFCVSSILVEMFDSAFIAPFPLISSIHLCSCL